MILTILKWIGIILLVLLGLVLLVLLLLLFAPFRYRAEGSFLENTPDGEARVNWLGPLLTLTVSYHQKEETPLHAILRVLGIKVFDFLEKKETNPGEETSVQAEAAVQAETAVQQETSAPAVVAEQEMQQEEKTSGAEDSKETPKAAEHISESNISEAAASGTESAADPAAEEKAGEADRVSFIDRIREKYTDLKNTAVSIYRMIRRKTDGCGKIWKMYKAEKNQKAISLLKRKLLQILKEVKPRKGDGYIRFGTGDPYTTAQVLQVAAILYPLYGDSIEVVPDLMDPVLECKGGLRGRIRLAVLAEAVLRVFFHKRLRAMYHKAREIAETEIVG